jgi:hypothetical protein
MARVVKERCRTSIDFFFLIFRATQRRDLHLIALLIKILSRNFILAFFFYHPGISLFFKIGETDIKHEK